MDQDNVKPKQAGDECGPWYVYGQDRIDVAGSNDQYGFLAGPFTSKGQADTHFIPAVNLAFKLDPLAVGYRYGVCRVSIPGYDKPGQLNRLLGLPTS